jgi:lipoate-protein ligase A
LPYAAAAGPHNMAADEVLLESAGAGVASLRLYGWATATASLGYFQPARLLREDPLLAALPFVRRPSGGDTLVHHHEVTYALGLPAGKPWQGKEPWPRRMHAILTTALRELGVEARPYEGAGQEAFTGPLCFHHLTDGDLLIDVAKVVGSAQRRHQGALLQHGAVLLARSPHAPSLPGIRELSGRDLGVEAVCTAVAHAFTRLTGWELVPSEWTTAERQRVQALAEEKYSQDDWNRKR